MLEQLVVICLFVLVPQRPLVERCPCLVAWEVQAVQFGFQAAQARAEQAVLSRSAAVQVQ
jgi:hypothetical protein